ncbi:MAG: transglycosylase SLT domain-containing protein [Pseudomonadota bacterium]
MRWGCCILVACALTACGARAVEPDAPGLPVMRWDAKPQAAVWTDATLNALSSHGAVLATLEPEDIDTWCPAYRDAGRARRQAFWAGVISALAWHESRHQPEASGGGGRWIGLMQIDPRTAGGFDCAAQSPDALKNGPANLACAVRIAAGQVPKRGSVRRGLRDWAPMHSDEKTAEMAAWTRTQPYCGGP